MKPTEIKKGDRIRVIYPESIRGTFDHFNKDGRVVLIKDNGKKKSIRVKEHLIIKERTNGTN